MWSTIVNAINSNIGNPDVAGNVKFPPADKTLNVGSHSSSLIDSDKPPFLINEKQLISSSEINTCYAISNENQSFFVKINDKAHTSHFECEAYNLTKLKETGIFSSPHVIDIGETLDKAFLILSHLKFQRPSTANWQQFGRALAQMHKETTHGQFGWQTDNYIGETIQPNIWQSNWRTFFSEQRIGWQLQLLKEKSIHIGDIEHIVMLCHDALLHHQAEPCLVHGDLWQGNFGFVDNQAVLFDPACYYGDREVDLAMTELFGNFPDAFYQGYLEYFPLDDGFEKRKIVYNFYHVLNHANMFGNDYIKQAKAMLARIISMQLH